MHFLSSVGILPVISGGVFWRLRGQWRLERAATWQVGMFTGLDPTKTPTCCAPTTGWRGKTLMLIGEKEGVYKLL